MNSLWIWFLYRVNDWTVRQIREAILRLVQAGTGAPDWTPELRAGNEKGRRGRIYQLITITDLRSTDTVN